MLNKTSSKQAFLLYKDFAHKFAPSCFVCWSVSNHPSRPLSPRQCNYWFLYAELHGESESPSAGRQEPYFTQLLVTSILFCLSLICSSCLLCSRDTLAGPRTNTTDQQRSANQCSCCKALGKESVAVSGTKGARGLQGHCL